MASFTLTKDEITPDLDQRELTPERRRELHSGAVQVIVSLAKRAISEPGLRPAVWPKLASGEPATLRDTGALHQSIRVFNAGTDSATAGSDRPYAAIHQNGGTIPPHERPRPEPKGGFNFDADNNPLSKRSKKKSKKSKSKTYTHPGAKIPARPYFPVLDGKLTKPATDRIRALYVKILDR